MKKTASQMPFLKEQFGEIIEDKRIRTYLTPQKIVWQSDGNLSKILNSERLLHSDNGQVTLDSNDACILENKGDQTSILLDFGVEFCGGIQIIMWNGGKQGSASFRVRFGESVMEAMSEIEQDGSTNDHAIRDQIVKVSALGMTEVGNSGFRFVRLDLQDKNTGYAEIKAVRGVAVHSDVEYLGSFNSDDSLLNKIYQTGAYTVHLNMQEYLWDGIKRDRLVWIGDVHPEISTISAVFGHNDCVPKSLDLIRDETELPSWMNGYPSYSMWWIICHHDWYLKEGNLTYLREQQTYLLGLMDQLIAYIDDDGKQTTPQEFIDWPSSNNPEAVSAGVQSIMIIALELGIKLLTILENSQPINCYQEAVAKMRTYTPNHNNSKQAAALLALADLKDSTEMNETVLKKDGSKRISTFLGYYVLLAKAKAGDIQGCLEIIREYWGGMLSLGATTFWEDFNIEWLDNAGRIDELVSDDKVDVHGAYGDYCYKGYRHSLCHGWASGPTAWLTEFVLGIKPVEPGCKVVSVLPNLGDLDWAEGTYPTPFGVISVKHKKLKDGTVQTFIDAPKEVEIIRTNSNN